MLIYIGADHRGYALKERLKQHIKDSGYEVVDLGNSRLDPSDDYPDFAKLVAKNVQADPEARRGVLICGSGVGVDIVANKFDRIRSALVSSADQASASREDDDTNILCLAADFVDEIDAKKIVTAWLLAQFRGEERHKRRISQINQIEAENKVQD